jgi:hypothetical protein
MKVFVVVAVVVSVMAGLAVPALATGDDWVIYIHAGYALNAGDSQPAAKYGIKTTGSDQFVWLSTPFDPGMPEIEYWDATHPLPADPDVDNRWYWALRAKSPEVDPATAPVVWHVRAVGAPNTTIYVTAWNPTYATGDLDGHVAVRLLEVVDGQLVNPYVFDPTKNGTFADRTGIGGTYFQRSYLLDETGFRDFVLVAGVPEPGGLACLLAGVSWLAGMGIRRKAGVKC